MREGLWDLVNGEWAVWGRGESFHFEGGGGFIDHACISIPLLVLGMIQHLLHMQKLCWRVIRRENHDMAVEEIDDQRILSVDTRECK